MSGNYHVQFLGGKEAVKPLTYPVAKPPQFISKEIDMEEEIIEIINRETRAWDTQNVELFLSIFHHDMVWPWPPSNLDHDPITWDLFLGKFNYERWKTIYINFFNENRLIHNNRKIEKIILSKENDGAFAVVDIDTLWENKKLKSNLHWMGRVSKTYAKVNNEWRLIMHTGVLKY